MNSKTERHEEIIRQFASIGRPGFLSNMTTVKHLTNYIDAEIAQAVQEAKREIVEEMGYQFIDFVCNNGFLNGVDAVQRAEEMKRKLLSTQPDKEENVK